ncbi:AAEL013724-PA, partial [Aedes aegypti]
QLDAIRRQLDHLLECLPGPRTPEQLIRFDDDQRTLDWEKYASEQYPDFLEELIARFDREFPGKEPHVDARIMRIFGIDYNHVFVVESLAMLTAADKLSQNREVLPFILSRLVQDGEYLGGCFVELSLKQTESTVTPSKHHHWHKSEQLVQILASIPNKVANVLQRDTPDTFLPERYSQIMLQQMLRAINSLAKITHLHTHLAYDTTFLAKLFSKLIVDYNFDKQSRYLQFSLRILTHWARFNDCQQRPLIAAICTGLSRPAVEVLAQIALREGIDLCNLFGSNDCTGDWNYVLTKKIPLFCSFSQDAIVENLIYLLARMFEAELKALSLELVTVWSSRTGIQKTSFEQHLYLSKLLVLSTTYLNQSKNGKLTAVEMREFRRLLFGGLKCHLESPVKEMRCVGMIVSEVILGYFDASDVEEANKLKFDYDGFDKDTLKLVDCLRNFKNRCRFVEDELSQNLISSEEAPIDQLIEKLFESGSSEAQLPSYENLQSQTVEPVSSDFKISAKHGSDDSELDSDDDLEPYDMSNDTNLEQEQHRPKYLLDLREILLDTSDQHPPARFELAIQAAPELIQQQLPNNDIKLALDLLQIILPLEARVYMENFQEYKFSALTAICSTYPKECAEYLCCEFHSELSKYSLNRRILMLDILAQTAKVLSNLDSTNRQSKTTTSEQPELAPTPKNALDLKFREENELLRKRQLAERIVRERIAGKTRHITSQRSTASSSVGSKLPTANRFSDVAGWFFFPLLRGFGSKQFLFTANLKFQYDADNLLLTTFLQTLSILMICAENCPIGRKFARELLNLSVMLRFSEEPKVRLSVLQVLSSIFLALPKAILRQDFYMDIVELKQWLEECVQASVVKGEPNEECREFARNVLVMCYGALAED